MSLAIVLELQTVQKNDEVTYSTNIILRYKKENRTFFSVSHFSWICCRETESQQVLKTTRFVLILAYSSWTSSHYRQGHLSLCNVLSTHTLCGSD